MKQVPNNEIGILLRKLSRSEGGHPPSGEKNAGPHLDADEVSAYVENVLPAAARAKYTEHLADCVNCRKIVSQLAGSSTTVKSAREAAPSWFQSFLAGLFSPMIIRYAIPGLAAVAILTLALVITLREKRQQSFVALNQRPTVQDSSAKRAQDFQTPTSGLVAESNQPEGTGTKTAQTADKAQPSAKGQTAATPKEAGSEVRNEVAVDRRVAEEKKSPTTKADTPVAPQENAPAPQATAEMKPKVVGRQAENVEVEQKRREARGQPATETKSEPARTDEVAAAPTKPRSAPSVGGGGRLMGGVATSRSERQERDKLARDSEEVRTVAGHRFRREDRAWIDVSYSSQAITNVTRDSEQFRALVADEPAIKTIADQLQGEVIVLWNGRAYRIR